MASSLSIAQEEKEIYHPSEIFEDHSFIGFTQVWIKDNIAKYFEVIEHSFIKSPNNPLTKEEENYLFHRKFQSVNGQIFSLDIFLDSIFLFTEYTKSINQKKDSIITSGRLKPSKTNFRREKLELLDRHGEDSIVTVKIPTLEPDGFWSINLDDRLMDVGKYKDGKREGEWHTIIAKYSDRKNPPIVLVTEYKSDSIISQTHIDKSNNLDFIKANLLGKWYNEGMDRENFNKCHDDNICNDFYVKNKEDAFYYGRLRGFYNYFLLLEDYKMEYIIGSACGTGIFLEDNEWKLNNEKLVLNRTDWNIEYFTEDRLIISK
ncbi:hypothetical protein ERX46_16020 [Brumimicrobium glaciale]|uniref:Uncharacterized protein n=1 Tax=Brumimicrobium glaciale TaxID=200475 RepID=A0A4Q4KHS9_9FLAO|nr:hypothetical protein [Brumimicrobium glaciale]RYM32187.1 hypothetical protein ERX46_16020 [Brumimicrobium glaciale]